jgi:peptide/nickel transport system permease protein
MANDLISIRTGEVFTPVTLPKRRSYFRVLLRRIMRSNGGMIGGGFIILLIFVAIAAPLLSPYDPIKMSPTDALQPPSWKHPAGTDRLGRDIMTRIIYGTRISLQLGFISVGISLCIGCFLGLIAGFFGGWIDNAVNFINNVLLALPGVLLALVILAALGPGLGNVMIAVGISSVPNYVRVVRGSVLAARASDYVEAARAIGSTNARIMFLHIAPNVMAPVIVLATLGFATAILIGASVSYLGLGSSPPTPEWGVMVSEGRNHLQRAWWLSTMPGLAIMFTVIALNLLGDSLRDALDPRLRT